MRHAWGWDPVSATPTVVHGADERGVLVIHRVVDGQQSTDRIVHDAITYPVQFFPLGFDGREIVVYRMTLDTFLAWRETNGSWMTRSIAVASTPLDVDVTSHGLYVLLHTPVGARLLRFETFDAEPTSELVAPFAGLGRLDAEDPERPAVLLDPQGNGAVFFQRIDGVWTPSPLLGDRYQGIGDVRGTPSPRVLLPASIDDGPGAVVLAPDGPGRPWKRVHELSQVDGSDSEDAEFLDGTSQVFVGMIPLSRDTGWWKLIEIA